MSFSEYLIVAVLLLLCVLSFILRELACWYWKINESLGVLKEIRDLLAIQQKSAHMVLTKPPSPVVPEDRVSEKPLHRINKNKAEQQANSCKTPSPAEQEASATEMALKDIDEKELELQAMRMPNLDAN